jgi:hypothetical protein
MSRSPEAPPEEMIPLMVTRSEAIAIGETIFSYYNHLREQEKLTPEQQFLAEHLASFYSRLASQVTQR